MIHSCDMLCKYVIYMWYMWSGASSHTVRRRKGSKERTRTTAPARCAGKGAACCCGAGPALPDAFLLLGQTAGQPGGRNILGAPPARIWCARPPRGKILWNNNVITVRSRHYQHLKTLTCKSSTLLYIVGAAPARVWHARPPWVRACEIIIKSLYIPKNVNMITSDLHVQYITVHSWSGTRPRLTRSTAMRYRHVK